MSKILRQSGIIFIYIYRFVSPAFHFMSSILTTRFQCRFAISCSEFALEELKSNQNLFSAMNRIIRRIFMCSPILNLFSESQIDAVSTTHCGRRGI